MKNTNWEEELISFLTTAEGPEMTGYMYTKSEEEIAAYVGVLLTSQKQSIIEGLEGMKWEDGIHVSPDPSYERALADAIKYIKEI